jgi:hypothetical protein
MEMRDDRHIWPQIADSLVHRRQVMKMDDARGHFGVSGEECGPTGDLAGAGLVVEFEEDPVRHPGLVLERSVHGDRTRHCVVAADPTVARPRVVEGVARHTTEERVGVPAFRCESERPGKQGRGPSARAEGAAQILCHLGTSATGGEIESHHDVRIEVGQHFRTLRTSSGGCVRFMLQSCAPSDL